MKMKNGFVGFALMSALAAHLQAAEAPSREALEKMFVTREAEWAAEACTHKLVEADLLWGRFHWHGYEGRQIFEATVH